VDVRKNVDVSGISAVEARRNRTNTIARVEMARMKILWAMALSFSKSNKDLSEGSCVWIGDPRKEIFKSRNSIFAKDLML
jgi:hypothetical protein